MEWTKALRPVFVLAIAVALAFPLLRLLPRVTRNGRAARALPAITLAVLAYITVTAVLYALYPSFNNSFEPVVATCAALLAHGEPVYTALDAPVCTNTHYGPASFVLAALFNVLGADAILAAKAAGVVQCIGGLAVLLVLSAPRFGCRIALTMTALVAAILLVFKHHAYWVRPDSLMILGTCLACGATLVEGRWRAVWLAGLGVGLTVGGKFHGAIYVLPLVPLFAARHGGRALITAAALSLLPVTLLFAFVPSFDLGAYLTQLFDVAGGHALSPRLFVANLAFFAVLALPVLVGYGLTRSALGCHRAYRVATMLYVLAGLLICVVAAKDGAGPHHLMVFAPVTAFLGAHAWRLLPEARLRSSAGARALVTAGVLVLASSALRGQVRVFSFLREYEASRARAELAGILERYPGSRACLGSTAGGGHRRLAFLSPLVVAHAGAAFVEDASIQDLRLAGRDVAPALADRIRQRFFDPILLPLGGTPFADLGPEATRAFRASYVRAENGEFFSVWRARKRAASRGG